MSYKTYGLFNQTYARRRQSRKKYAALMGISLEEAFKNALFEKIEDEYDIAIGEAAVEEFHKNPTNTCLIEDLINGKDL